MACRAFAAYCAGDLTHFVHSTCIIEDDPGRLRGAVRPSCFRDENKYEHQQDWGLKRSRNGEVRSGTPRLELRGTGLVTIARLTRLHYDN